MSITRIISRICELQPRWTSRNTAEMKERGMLVRNDLVKALRLHEGSIKDAMGRFSIDWHIHGRDGSGRKTEAPWVRICSLKMSPRATEGFYMVIHFSADGSSVFVTIGHGSNNWHPNGSLIPFKPEELATKVGLGRKVLMDRLGSMDPFVDKIRLGAVKAGPENFERATVCAKCIPVADLSDEVFLKYVMLALKKLSVIYEAVSLGAGLDAFSLLERDADYLYSPLRNHGAGQGFGASAEDRKAIELFAMKQAKSWMKTAGFTKIKDCSGSKSYDFVAESDSRAWKIEVKGTTADRCDAILMTSNEVELHRAERGSTVIVIVYGIILDRTGHMPRASGGTVWADVAWDIDASWSLVPTAYRVSRK